MSSDRLQQLGYCGVGLRLPAGRTRALAVVLSTLPAEVTHLLTKSYA